MTFSTLPGYVAGHRFSDESTNFFNAGKFIDQAGYSARGQDLTITAGDISTKFETVGAANGKRGLRLDNTVQGKCKMPIPWMGTMIFVFKPEVSSGVTTRSRYTHLFGDNPTTTANGRMAIAYFSGNRYAQAATGSAQASMSSVGGLANDSTRVIAVSFDQETRTCKWTYGGTVNSSAAASSTTNGNAVAPGAAGVGVRFGNLSGVDGDFAQITDFTVLAFAQYFYSQDLLTGTTLTALQTAIAELKAIYGAS